MPEPVAGSPVVPGQIRDAATVMLVRDTDHGMETFLLRRVSGMTFAPGMTVFPGGGVDPRDAHTPLGWTGPDAAWWARRLSCDPDLAAALVCAAVRETFEEAGVLLAGPDEQRVVADVTPYAPARHALADGELSLAEFLRDARLVLRADLLRPWSHWLTPVAEPRRYDTRFFLAAMPHGQHADGSTPEADHAGWWPPADALADARAGRHSLLLPTRTTLTELSECGSVADALAVERTVRRITPEVVWQDGVARVLLPGDGADDSAPHPVPGDGRDGVGSR